MNRVKRYSNWCEIDQLDGRDLIAGELLEVIWPNRNREAVTVQVDLGTYTIMDHGHPFEARRAVAYVTKEINGVSVKVPLLGLEAKRVP